MVNDMDEKVRVSKIVHGSLEDGKGIRTVVFFAGCPLSCKWCHNPECIEQKPVIMYLKNKCILCGKCISVCKDAISADASGIKIDREKCTSCGECSKVCLGEALSLSQSEMTTDEIFSEIIADISYYKYSGGGVTFSGGECLRQPDALKDILLSCKKEGINTCIETCLDISWKTVSEIAEYTDSFFVDIKLMDRNKHKEYTNVGNARIIENITKLFKEHSDITFRIPLIPGVNDDMANLEQTVNFVSLLEGNGERRIEVLRYNNLAESKYESIGKKFTSFGEVQSDSDMEKLKIYLNNICDNVKVY